jgi:hypothetical protein
MKNGTTIEKGETEGAALAQRKKKKKWGRAMHKKWA